MKNIKTFESPFDFFFDYFFSFNQSIDLTLRTYGMVRGRVTPVTLQKTWNKMVRDYPQEYSEAKKTYLQSLGIEKSKILIETYNIANFSAKDSDRLRAIELLLRYVEDDVPITEQSLNTIKVEVVTPSDMNKEL